MSVHKLRFITFISYLYQFESKILYVFSHSTYLFCWNWRGILVECYFREHAKLDRNKKYRLTQYSVNTCFYKWYSNNVYLYGVCQKELTNYEPLESVWHISYFRNTTCRNMSWPEPVITFSIGKMFLCALCSPSQRAFSKETTIV